MLLVFLHSEGANVEFEFHVTCSMHKRSKHSADEYDSEDDDFDEEDGSRVVYGRLEKRDELLQQSRARVRSKCLCFFYHRGFMLGCFFVAFNIRSRCIVASCVI